MNGAVACGPVAGAADGRGGSEHEVRGLVAVINANRHF